MIEEDIEQLRREISVALETDDNVEILKLLSSVNIAEVALLLDSLPSQQRDSIWPLIEPSDLGAVLLETQDDISDAKLKELDPEEIAAIRWMRTSVRCSNRFYLTARIPLAA
jgi:Mg/Co/Ni transporter MgtE